MKTYRAFIDWDQCERGRKPTAGTLRLFESPFAKALRDGTPSQPYIWISNVKLFDETVLVKGTLTSPPAASVPALKQLGRAYGCKFLELERLKNGKLIKRTYPL